MSESRSAFYLVSHENSERISGVIKRLSNHRRIKWLKDILSGIHPNSLAFLWSSFDTAEKELIIGLLSIETRAEFLAELEEDERADIFKSKNTDWIAQHLTELEADDIVDILKGLSSREADFIIKKFDADYSNKLKDLLQYPEETAGALMNSDFLAVNENARIDTIVRQFRKFVAKVDIEDIHIIYVVDKEDKLKGYIPLRKLILEEQSKKAKDVLVYPSVYLTPEMDQEAVAAIFKDYDLISAAVVDENQMLLGRITIDDVVDVLDEEASEDVFRMVGLKKKEVHSDSYLNSLRSRLPWMMINLVTSGVSAMVVSFFMPVINQFIMLAMFMPMIAALGGATGNQMVAMVVRGIATGEILNERLRKIILREMLTVITGSIGIGIIIGFVAFIVSTNKLLPFVILVSVVLNMSLATLIGFGYPLLLRLFKKDPALGSSILVAATTDMMGFLIFLALASKYLS
jgi:magnesium transporter